MWILTGDKVETAAYICRSTGLVKTNRPIYIVVNQTRERLEKLMYEKDENSNEVLLADGKTLKLGLEIDEMKFLKFCMLFKFVCLARCSPK